MACSGTALPFTCIKENSNVVINIPASESIDPGLLEIGYKPIKVLPGGFQCLKKNSDIGIKPILKSSTEA
jgi:hypothetical protein